MAVVKARISAEILGTAVLGSEHTHHALEAAQLTKNVMPQIPNNEASCMIVRLPDCVYANEPHVPNGPVDPAYSSATLAPCGDLVRAVPGRLRGVGFRSPAEWFAGYSVV